ncbi:MAG: HEXXH motif-containing putative peptide modification protein [Nitrospira sp.]|nr:HEXXH motif-containing putative peptide modification protein [Nitrospira sp.]MDH4245598.1 HEXXH motif-containing putative peptide modification protein [Nitrospira sp.]MDH4354836.1 HEXXH motif-containing putative peptide modification protein [Nitrospira sp.]MDH5317090.1 HEXXH motif-containing putative peptide modification protein [Nitrospira sp.]
MTSGASVGTAFERDMLTDCDGLCYPSAPGSTVDLLLGYSALARAERLREHLLSEIDKNRMDKSELQLANRIRAILDNVPRDCLSCLFSTPLAEIDTAPNIDQREGDCTSVNKRFLLGVRHMIHHPALPDATFVLPPSLFFGGPLYLPHLNAMLRNDEPAVTLAVVESEGKTRFVWSDGLSLTLINDGSKLPEDFKHPRLRALPHAGGIPVLNEIAEIAPTLSAFEPAAQEEIAIGVQRVEAALKLLKRIWPLAFHALSRHIKAFCILRHRSYSRSHSPPELPGTVFLSVEDVECLGDLLCHESSHVRMNIFRWYDSIVVARNPEADAASFVSPWRSDLRPIQGLLDGVHAFLNVCRYYRRLEDQFQTGETFRTIYERQRKNVIQANVILQQHAKPTTIGAILLNQFALEVAQL